MRFAREVRIGELLTALALISGAAATYIEMRLRPVENEIKTVRDAAGDFKKEIREDLLRMESKLDLVRDALLKGAR